MPINRGAFAQIYIDQLKDWSVSVDLNPVELSRALSIRWSDDTGLQIAGDPVDPTFYSVRFWDQALAHINFAGKWVRIAALSSDVPSETLRHFLVDQIYPRIIAHVGQMVLHAGAIGIEGQAVAFLGPSGAGKSTLVASYYGNGAVVLGDDVLIVSHARPRFHAEPIYPSLRLLPDTIATLFPVKPDLEAFAHYSSKQRVALPPLSQLPEGGLPLAALFFLRADQLDDGIVLRQLSWTESCIGLITNSFSLDPTDAIHSAAKLRQASAIGHCIPAFELSYPRDYARLTDVHDAIRAALEENPVR